MEKYFEIEVTRTVTERRKIYVKADNGEAAHDAAVEHAEWEKVKAPWGDPAAVYSTVKTAQIDKPENVDLVV
jgi:hypothetical protein